ncbi:MAG TPA: GNAT family N-acetyltransferase [Verrucomicrobiae bacterium]|nr:GNAT family N-acetyltransferase [Verrucomicrobiae bacterium]
MNLNQVTVPCTDLAASVAFYRALGLREIVSSPPDYARFECPVGGSTFSVHRTTGPVVEGGVTVYFELEDLDATVSALKSAGLEFDSEPQDQPWLWREAFLRDPAGNRICLFHAGENRRNPPWRMTTDVRPEPVVSSDPAPDDIQYLEDRIGEFNLAATGIAGGAWLSILVRDDRHRIVAGICGNTWGGCAEVRQFWVEESRRGRGLGTALLEAAETEARRRGCRQLFLMTFSFQAPAFYARRGFEVIAAVDDHPRGHRNLLLRKRLAPSVVLDSRPLDSVAGMCAHSSVG